MDLTSAQQFLVIVLSTALAIFLILSIAIAIMVINLLRTARNIAHKAEDVVDKAESAAAMLKTTATTAGALRLVQKLFTTISKHKKNKGEN